MDYHNVNWSKQWDIETLFLSLILEAAYEAENGGALGPNLGYVEDDANFRAGTIDTCDVIHSVIVYAGNRKWENLQG